MDYSIKDEPFARFLVGLYSLFRCFFVHLFTLGNLIHPIPIL